MNSGFSKEIDGICDGDGFTVRALAGCRIVYGLIPLSEFVMLKQGFSQNALIDPDLADRIGATCVIGEPPDLDALRGLDLPVSAKRMGDARSAQQMGLDDVARWLRTGERGASSNAMCKRLFGVPADAGTSHPRDPDDLRRCLLFLDSVHAHDRVPMMAGVSAEWDRLVAAWGRIAGTFYQEMKDGKSAPRTRALMGETVG